MNYISTSQKKINSPDLVMNTGKEISLGVAKFVFLTRLNVARFLAAHNEGSLIFAITCFYLSTLINWHTLSWTVLSPKQASIDFQEQLRT